MKTNFFTLSNRNNFRKLWRCLDLQALQYLELSLYKITEERRSSLEDNAMTAFTPTTKRRLEIQGFKEVDPGVLEETVP